MVVDAGSFDGCAKMLASEFPEVDFVQSEENIGFGRANNLGFERAHAPVVLLLNPDTELTPGVIENLVIELKRRPDAGILGPKLLNTDGSLQTSCVRALPTPLNRALDSEFVHRMIPDSRLFANRQICRLSSPSRVEAVSGACMMLPLDVFRRVGGFSPEFFMYGEDMDLCAKVRKLGLNIYHVPHTEVTHHGGGSSQKQVSEFSTVMMRMAAQTYMRKHRGRVTALSYRILQACSAIIRLSLMLSTCWLLSSLRRKAVLESVRKWWYVFRWALGASPIRLPERERLPQKEARADARSPSVVATGLAAKRERS